MNRYALTSMGAVCALGSDARAIERRLFESAENRLTPHRLRTVDAVVPAGQIQEPLRELPESYARFRCRNHAIALAALDQIETDLDVLRSLVPPRRIGVVIGSSTSGMDTSELAFYQWRDHGALPSRYNFEGQHEMASVSQFIALAAGVNGPAYTVSTACSSSAKAFASAAYLLDLGVCDAVIVGGVDTLCDITLNGFEALASLSRVTSNPLSRNRDGLNIGEGGALFLLTKGDGAVFLRGVGESCDAHHVSAPDPEGQGAETAMRAALAAAGMTPGQIDYINLHGTGTPLNDAMESGAVRRIFQEEVWCGSTKPRTGHCLGAAGALEAAICWMAIRRGQAGRPALPAHVWDGVRDEALPRLRLVAADDSAPTRVSAILSNSFAFGGSNCSLVFGSA